MSLLVKTANDVVYGLIRGGLDADKPAPGVADRFYFATDTIILYRDTGAAWSEVARGETAIRLAQLAERAHVSLTGIGVSDHHIKTVAGELNLADMAERAHVSLTGIGVADHHGRYTNAEAVAAAEAAGLALASGKSIKLEEALSADLSWCGFTCDGVAGENLAQFEVCYLKADGKYWKADANAAATMPVVAMATAAISADDTGLILLMGFVRKDTWTWTIGGVLYASTTPGAMEQPAPVGAGDQVQELGVARPNHIIYFFPIQTLVEIA